LHQTRVNPNANSLSLSLSRARGILSAAIRRGWSSERPATHPKAEVRKFNLPVTHDGAYLSSREYAERAKLPLRSCWPPFNGGVCEKGTDSASRIPLSRFRDSDESMRRLATGTIARRNARNVLLRIADIKENEETRKIDMARSISK